MAELVERLGHDGRIRHVRDREYFAWRFLNPRASYRFLYAQSARLEGYLVLAAQPGRPDWGVRLVDWEAVDDRVRRALLVAAFQKGGDELGTAVLKQGLLSDPIDKTVTFFVVFAILGALSRRFVARLPQGENAIGLAEA